MAGQVTRSSVDLSQYPEMVVMYLGMRVNVFTGLKTLFGLGPQIAKSAADRPDGLLLHENIIYSLFPPHLGMRQYWRDFESLAAWSSSTPHKVWWQNFLKNSGGTGFWHETYFMQGGMEAIYDDMKVKLGFSKFAPVKPAVGSPFSEYRKILKQRKVAEPAANVENNHA